MPTLAKKKPASRRQLAYIERLRAEPGEDCQEVDQEISSFAASQLISELILRANGSGTRNGQPDAVRINEPRLGMAIKESFRYWTGLGRDVWEEKREPFIIDAIDTYELFTEIAKRVEQKIRLVERHDRRRLELELER